MPVIDTDRPIAALREETIDQLISNYGHGKLSIDAFERRLDQALDAKSHETLSSLTDDLELIAEQRVTEQRKRELGVQTGARDANEVNHLITLFSGRSKKGRWTAAEEILVVNVCGGSDLDFSDARLASQATRVKVFCLCGGVNIRIPEGMRVVSNAIPLFGGVSDRSPTVDDPDAPTVIVDGIVLFGGIDIRIKKRFKDRLLAFADSIRGMFDPAH